MQFQVTYIDFDFSTTTTPEGDLLFLDDPTWGDIDYDTQQEVIEETKVTIWEADGKDDLIKKIADSIGGWRINDIDYHVVEEEN